MDFPVWFVRINLFRISWNLLFGLHYGRKISETTAFDFESDHLSNERRPQAFGIWASWLARAQRVLFPLPQSSSLVAEAAAAPSPKAALPVPRASWLLPLARLLCHPGDTPSAHLLEAGALDASLRTAGNLTRIQMDATKNNPFFFYYFFPTQCDCKAHFLISLRAGEVHIEPDIWWSS